MTPIVQTCTVHLIRNTFRLTSRKDSDAIKRDIKPIDTAPNADAALAAPDVWGASLTGSLTTYDFVSQQPPPPAPGSRAASPLARDHRAPVTDLTTHRLLRTPVLGSVINEYRYAA